MCHRWKRPFLWPLCHGVFKSSTLHFSGKMGKQSAISPITSSLPRRRGRNSGVRWICLSIRWFECQFVSTAAPKIRKGKHWKPPQKRASKAGPAALPANLVIATSLCIGCKCGQAQVALSSALTPCPRRPFPLVLLGV